MTDHHTDSAEPLPSRREGAIHRLAREPFFLGAVVVLGLNDHVLKPALHNAATGKLSDLAGLFAVGFAASALPARRASRLPVAALLLVGVAAFVAVNLSADVASHVERVLDGLLPWDNRITPDPIDLATAPAAAVGWLAATRRPERAHERSARPPRRRSRVDPRLVLPLAVLVATASYRNPEPWLDHRGPDGEVEVFNTDEGGSARAAGRLADLTDSGRHEPPDIDGAGGFEGPDFEPSPDQLADCRPGVPDHCIRVVDQLELQETDDGGATWSSVFRIDPEADEADAGWVADQYSYADRDPGFRQVVIDTDGAIAALIAHETWLLRTPDGRWSRDEASFRSIAPGLVAMLLGGLGLSSMTVSAVRSSRLREMIGDRPWPAIGLVAFVVTGLLGTPGRIVAAVPLVMGGLLGLIGLVQGADRHRLLSTGVALVPTAVASIGLQQWHLTGDPDRARIVVLFTVTLALGAVIATLVDTRTRRPVDRTDDTWPSID